MLNENISRYLVVHLVAYASNACKLDVKNGKVVYGRMSTSRRKTEER